MKLVFTLFILTIVAIAALAFLGKQLGVDVVDIKAPTLPTINSVNDVESAVTGSVTVHKWQDKNGQWHFGDQPDELTPSQEMVIHTDQNVIQAYKPPTTANSGNKTPADDPELADELGMGTGPLPSQMLLQLKQQAAEKALKDRLGQ